MQHISDQASPGYIYKAHNVTAPIYIHIHNVVARTRYNQQ